MNGLPELLLAGPTAVGKTEVALRLAERLNGEIISVDSMQVYRGLDIGTAKPSAEERTRIRHHLIDILDLHQAFDAAQFVRHATEAVREIRSRNHLPILCGGTGLYFKAWLEGVGEAPAGNAALRAELERLPMDLLLRELRDRDPEMYERIDRKNPRRVIRAIEVIRLTGKPFSQQRARKPVKPAAFFVLNRERTDLHERIDRRVDEMFARGMVEEAGLAFKSPAARQALGYRQVIEHFEGKHTIEEAIALVKLRTRQYAKRQITWFRHQATAEWIDAGDAAVQIEKKFLLATGGQFA